MAVAFQLDFDAPKEKYEEVCRRLDVTHMFGGMAAGGMFHLATVHDGKVRIFDVWHSETAMRQFVETALMPVLQQVGVPAPKVTPLQLLATRK